MLEGEEMKGEMKGERKGESKGERKWIEYGAGKR